MSAAGVRIAVGTDGNTPWAPHVEMADMVAAGMTPAQVIVAATRNGAEFLRMTDTGTIEAGKSADFIVLDANPLDDITNTRKISTSSARRRQYFPPPPPGAAFVPSPPPSPPPAIPAVCREPSNGSDAQAVSGEGVTGNFFPALGVEPALGPHAAGAGRSHRQRCGSRRPQLVVLEQPVSPRIRRSSAVRSPSTQRRSRSSAWRREALRVCEVRDAP